MSEKCNLPQNDCGLCPRLVDFRCKNQQAYPHFYNGAVPSFGELSAGLLIVGLAPGLQGANATGRPFTGDYAGEVLYPALIGAGFAGGDWGLGIGDLRSYRAQSLIPNPESLFLINTRITNAVRCVPPENKPTPAEIKTCNAFLKNEIAAMPNLKVILTLGLVSHNAVLKALGLKAAGYKFGHGINHQSPITNHQILNSYHTSRYNINTGRLTQAMFDGVMAQAKEMLG